MIDHCAGCGKPLKPHPSGATFACCWRQGYWSQHAPALRDRRFVPVETWRGFFLYSARFAGFI